MLKYTLLLVFFYFFHISFVITLSSSPECIPRYYNKNASFVCVCNSTFCDTVQPPILQAGKVLVYTSSAKSERFSQSYIPMNNKYQYKIKFNDNPVNIAINTSTKYQKIKGFGGALTDAASINILSLSKLAQMNLIKSYFGKIGIEYNVIRLPIGSCDYSPRKYTYLEKENDFNLTTFALAKEDIELKLPVLRTIFSLSAKNVSLFGSPWTAPAWMKSNQDEVGWGWLLGEAGDKYHKTWAQYFVKYFNEFKKLGIHFWGLTMQNEPTNGFLVKAKWQSTGWTPQSQRDFIKLDLGPALHAGGYENLKLMILDDQRIFLPAWPQIILDDPEAAKYVSGIGIHWYWNWLAGPDMVAKTHEVCPNVFILGTEACNKKYLNDTDNWGSGEKYSNDILDNLNNWGAGWVDWNIALDLGGGPSWVPNWDASPIIVNATADEFYKQPMFYHLGHFSKFISEGSVRVKSTSSIDVGLKFVAVLHTDGSHVLVILNQSSNNVKAIVNVDDKSSFMTTVPQRSIQTYIWK